MYKSNHTEYELIKLTLQGFVTRPETRIISWTIDCGQVFTCLGTAGHKLKALLSIDDLLKKSSRGIVRLQGFQPSEDHFQDLSLSL